VVDGATYVNFNRQALSMQVDLRINDIHFYIQTPYIRKFCPMQGKLHAYDSQAPAFLVLCTHFSTWNVKN